jgi:hypothetical protein
MKGKGKTVPVKSHAPNGPTMLNVGLGLLIGNSIRLLFAHWQRWLGLIFTRTLIGCFYVPNGFRKYVSTLFEQERYFSALTEIEREMSFRSEQVSSSLIVVGSYKALYYSYFKDMLQEFKKEKTFFQGFLNGFKVLLM